MTGISFRLTQEQRELQALAHEFAERELRPIAAECDAPDPDRIARGRCSPHRECSPIGRRCRRLRGAIGRGCTANGPALRNILELATGMALGRALRRGVRGQDTGGTVRSRLETARKWGRSGLDRPPIAVLIDGISACSRRSRAHRAAILYGAQRRALALSL